MQKALTKIQTSIWLKPFKILIIKTPAKAKANSIILF